MRAVACKKLAEKPEGVFRQAKQVCGNADLFFWRKMERIMIIGCSGSGKSTMAKVLQEKLGLPLIHLDQLFWEPGWQMTEKENFDRQLQMAVDMERWIIDGNYNRTIPMRLAKCDTIIYLDFNRWECLLGVFQRIITSYGKVRSDMGEGCPERFDWDFLRYVWNFNKNNRVRNYTYLGQAKHAKRIVLKNRKEVKQFLNSL